MLASLQNFWAQYAEDVGLFHFNFRCDYIVRKSGWFKTSMKHSFGNWGHKYWYSELHVNFMAAAVISFIDKTAQLID